MRLGAFLAGSIPPFASCYCPLGASLTFFCAPDGIREGATTNDPATELGRAPLTMGKPSSPVETLKITLSGAGDTKGKLLIEWENVTASVPFTVK